MAQILSTRGSRHASLTVLLVASGLEVHAATEISGIEGPLLANVRAYLTLDSLGCDAAPAEVRQEYGGVEDQIGEALTALGYYQPVITSNLAFDEDCWTASLDIDPGPQVIVRTLDFAIDGGEDDPTFAMLASDPGIAVGDGLHHGRYEELKRGLLDLARDRGYPDARFVENRIDVYPDEMAADIVLRFATGPRYRFGQITLEQEAFADDFLEPYIEIEPGQPFDNAALVATYVGLTDSGYFDTIDVRALDPDPEALTIPVRVTLVGTPRLHINYGVGFSTDTGPRLRIGRAFRRLNNRGQQLSLQAQLAPVISEVTTNFRHPYGDPRFEWASFDGGIRRERTDTVDSESLRFGARRIFERIGGFTRTQFVDLLVENFDVADQSGRSRLLMPGISWTRVRADNTLRPARGRKLDIEFRGAAASLGSDTTFVQTIIDYGWVGSFGTRSRVLLRAELGATAEDKFDDLPPSVRFFAGGDSSIRGYAYESLGPVDSDGAVIGGSRLIVASAEYEHSVRPKWSVATFVDSGNAFRGSRLEAKTGVGIGARWQSPLGPVRLDVGFPLDDPTRTARIHISLGPDL